jgi:hypothetical protein
VKQVQVLSMNLELPNGVKAKSEERKVKELSDFVVPGSSSNSGLQPATGHGPTRHAVKYGLARRG